MQPENFNMQLVPFSAKTIIASLAITIGISLLFLKSWILEYMASSLLFLTPNSIVTDIWLQPPDVSTLKVYLFNWTNPDDFLKPGTKPRFHELGPYSYILHNERKNVVWNDNNTVTFNTARTFYFNEGGSKGNLSDELITIHFIAAAAGHYLKDHSSFLKYFVSTMHTANFGEISFKLTVDELLATGFEDPVLNFGNMFPFLVSNMPHFDRVGFILMRNASADYEGTFNMGNGLNGDFNLHNWNYNSITPHYDGACAKLGGSNGELYSRTAERTDFIELFFFDLCRSLRLDFKEEVEVDGINGYKYALGKASFDNGTLIPENKCFCNGECLPSGVANVTPCWWNLPVFASLPHFAEADPVYLDAVEGLHPEKVAEPYIVLEPNTNVLLELATSFQFNYYIQPIEGMSFLEGIPKIMFPVGWVKAEAKLPELLLSYLKTFLMVKKVLLGTSVGLILLGVSILLFVNGKSALTSLFTKNAERRLTTLPKHEEIAIHQFEIQNMLKT